MISLVRSSIEEIPRSVAAVRSGRSGGMDGVDPDPGSTESCGTMEKIMLPPILNASPLPLGATVTSVKSISLSSISATKCMVEEIVEVMFPNKSMD